MIFQISILILFAGKKWNADFYDADDLLRACLNFLKLKSYCAFAPNPKGSTLSRSLGKQTNGYLNY